VGASALVFRAEGVPVPQGSMRGFLAPDGNIAITSDNPHLKRWRQVVATAAAVELWSGPRAQRGIKIGPMLIDLVFVLPRPESLPRRVVEHLTRPDVDKLVRAVFDALTGVVWADDKQVIGFTASKRYARATESPGVWVSVGPAGAPLPRLPFEPS
jgi:crossover junction endodeoxyribonuclease RusA